MMRPPAWKLSTAAPALLLAACASTGSGDRTPPADPPDVSAGSWAAVDSAQGVVMLLASSTLRASGDGRHTVWTKSVYQGTAALAAAGERAPLHALLVLWEVDCARRRARQVRSEAFSATGAHLDTSHGAGTPAGAWASHWFQVGASAAALRDACALASAARAVAVRT
ncbi:MAG TPA: hypothetical protein VF746_15390 [Longimicrobium sp.]|jgi:hypothetical protein